MAQTPEKNNGIPEELTPDEDAKGRSIIEAVLTASDAPVTASQLVGLVGGDAGAKEIRQYIDELNEVYVKTGRAFRVTEVAGGFQFSVHHEFAPWIRQLLQEKPARLSQAALEVLSIVAFKQPITKAEVEHIRGVASDGVLRHLMENGLVRIAGRSDGVGRPLLYGTARDFLKFFGLKTLADLPRVREVEDLLKEDVDEGGPPPDDTPDSLGAGEEGASDPEEASAESEAAEIDADSEEVDDAEEDDAGDREAEEVKPDGAEAESLAADIPEPEEEASDEESEEGEGTAGPTEQISGESGSRVEESV